MLILSAEGIRNWDEYTIQHEPISSIDLMERAARACVQWLEKSTYQGRPVHIFCGKGNNGGDGLAIARMLAMHGQPCTVHILEFGHIGTNDFQTNLSRLHQQALVDIRFIQDESHFHSFGTDDIVIDALFGTGLNRGLEGVTARLVEQINQSGRPIISIDVPSGLFADRSSGRELVVNATHTLSFQCYKLAFLVAENQEYIGQVHILDIGLHPDFAAMHYSRLIWLDDVLAASVYRPRPRFVHKGSAGHALLIAGSYGKMGAAVLAAKGCMRGGVGLLSCHIPANGLTILQTALPEAMVLTDFNSSYITRLDTDTGLYDAIGTGPGIGTAQETRTMLRELLDNWRGPLVVDADALNNISIQKDFLTMLPGGTILTPHPKEFDRLFGPSANDFARIELALSKAKELGVVIVLKGHHSLVATPEGKGFFNSTGNAGMATAGSGDLLTGLLTALLAQGYAAVEAALLGVFLHGRAGDLASAEFSQEAMIASDIAEQLGAAFRSLTKT
ncbi:MAG: NAD(P)H-hydrate dehydratase [Chitinophagaceae bacterium]